MEGIHREEALQCRPVDKKIYEKAEYEKEPNVMNTNTSHCGTQEFIRESIGGGQDGALRYNKFPSEERRKARIHSFTVPVQFIRRKDNEENGWSRQVAGGSKDSGRTVTLDMPTIQH